MVVSLLLGVAFPTFQTGKKILFFLYVLLVFRTQVRAKLKTQLQVFVGTYPSILHCVHTAQRKRVGAVFCVLDLCRTSFLPAPPTIPQLLLCFPHHFKFSLKPTSSLAYLCPEPLWGRCNPQRKKKGAINDGVQRQGLGSDGDLLRTMPKIIKS